MGKALEKPKNRRVDLTRRPVKFLAESIHSFLTTLAKFPCESHSVLVGVPAHEQRIEVRVERQQALKQKSILRMTNFFSQTIADQIFHYSEYGFIRNT